MAKNNPSKGLRMHEAFRLRLKGMEYCELPLPLRKGMVKGLGDPFERSVTLDDGREVCFIHVPKTGGTSIASCLGCKSGHIPISRYYAWDSQRLAASFTFAFVRSPWNRIFSSYNYLSSAIGLNRSPDVRWATENLAQFTSFEEFVHALRDQSLRRKILRWPHFRPQIHWLVLPGGDLKNIDFLGRYERLNEDVDRLASELGLDISLPHLRRANSYSERPIFTREMEEIIRGVYADDVAAFDYNSP